MVPTRDTNSLAIILSVFTQHVEAGGRGTLRVEPGADGARRVNLTLDLKDGSVRRRKNPPGQLRRDQLRKEAWLRKRGEGSKRRPPEDVDSYAPDRGKLVERNDSAPSPALCQVALFQRNSGKRGNNGKTKATPYAIGASQSTDLDHSPMELESDSVGREKYHQFVVQEEEFKLCRNFSVKLHSHRACTIPNKKIDSIKACNRAPESGGIAYLSHSCRKCSNNPPLVKTAKNNLGHTTYHVHETVEKFNVCTPCTKYKTSKICTMLNQKKTQKEDMNKKGCTREELWSLVDDLKQEWKRRDLEKLNNQSK